MQKPYQTFVWDWKDGQTFPKARPTDTEYSAYLDRLTVVCSDVVLIDRKNQKLWLAHRVIEPIKSWWVMGGGIRPGDDPAQGALNHFKRDTGFTLGAERLSYLGLFNYHFGLRQIGALMPERRPFNSLAFTYTVEPTLAELENLTANLRPTEYDTTLGLKAFGQADLENPALHPALTVMWKMVFSQ
jgi:ADP-ribose pyrophosphatase YjhB (NUDIX family)